MHAYLHTLARVRRSTALIALLVLVNACSGHGGPARPAVDVLPGDVCAVCGMELSHSPGPRAEAWAEGRSRPLMFDSTRDFFAYVLQPENQPALHELFVQDTTRIDWQHPGHAADTFIDARSAVYVAWQPLPGSMGPTFAPFPTRAAAQSFARLHGGAVLGFGEVTPNLVAALQNHCPSDAVTMGGHTIACHAPSVSSVGQPTTARPHRAPSGSAQPTH